MLVSFSRLAAAVLSLASIASAANLDKESCTRSNPWAPRTHAGADWGNNPDSHYFCEAGYIDGNVLTGIRVWKGDWGVWGLAFQWGELEWGKVYGTPNGPDKKTPRAPDQELTWSAGEQVAIRMKHNIGKGTKGLSNGNKRDAVGWLEVTVGTEVKMNLGSAHAESQWLNIDTGAKKIVALQGKSAIIAGEDNKPVETLEFFYLESNTASSALTDIKFAEDINAWNSMKKGIQYGASMGEAWFVNRNPKGGLNQTFSITSGVDITTSQSVGDQHNHAAGFGLSSESTVVAKLPFMVQGKTTVGGEVHYEYTNMDMSSRDNTTGYHMSFMQGAQFATGIPPQSATNCSITATVGKFESDYTATITVTLDNGKKFAFYERGTATTINHVGAVAGCETMPLDKMPQVGTFAHTYDNGTDVQPKRRRHEEDIYDPIARGLKRAIKFFA